MAYRIIKGSFHVAGYSPDGDSVRFEACNPNLWNLFKWKSQATKKAKNKQLRLEAIDALETHYEESHQPRSFGLAAMEAMLGMIGVTDIVYNLNITKIVSAKDGTPGYLAVFALDIYDRPISLVFSGSTVLPDGAEVTLAELGIEQSVNLQLLRLGLAYPTFYTSMPDELIDRFTSETALARAGKVGLWTLDKTMDFMFWNRETINDDIVILPKLFRRLTTFLDSASSYNELKAFLLKSNDQLILRPTRQATTLGKLIEVSDRRIQLTVHPETMVFKEKR
ncbi:MAG: thermonuclease family protein [Chlorobiaceae bacterium]